MMPRCSATHGTLQQAARRTSRGPIAACPSDQPETTTSPGKSALTRTSPRSFTPKDKTRYGWRAWTSLWNPAPVDARMCTPMLYGPKEYLETLGNISHCAVDYVENAAACESDTTCEWKAMFESGVCFQDPKSVTPTTTMAGVTYSTIEVTLPLTVDDAAAILNNATVQGCHEDRFCTGDGRACCGCDA